MENTLSGSPVLDRERRKRIQKSEQVLEFSTNVNRAVKRLDKNIDLAIQEIRKNEQLIFKQPYKDWRTND
jgi:hypothetical protein